MKRFGAEQQRLGAEQRVTEQQRVGAEQRRRFGGGVAERNRRVGCRGEQVAADYLRDRGYRLLARNWRSPDPAQRGELDLVLRHRRELVICEVKTRTGTRLANPADAVTQAKAARLRRLAAIWCRENAVGGGRARDGRAWTAAWRSSPSVGKSLWKRTSRRRHWRQSAWWPSRRNSAGQHGARDRPRSSEASCRRRGEAGGIRIDVIAVRLSPKEPYPVLSIEHLVGVA